MALEDKDIFTAICNRYADQSIEFIMDQYEKAKKMNISIEKKLATLSEMPAGAFTEVAEVKEEAVVEEQPARKRHKKPKFVVKPQEAISEDSISCCICGAQRQSLTSTHLATHDLTVEEYKKMCGYLPNQKLMSGRRLAKSKEIIGRAQKARLEKIASKEEY